MLKPDPQIMLKLAQYKMPFGKYKDCLLVDLPEPYVIWFSNKGFPEGELGELLAIVLEIKINGLEYLFQPLKKQTRW
ncbi:MAG: DUF3820 family protein [Pseudomonadota bacterium]